tara:strand:- start:200 stop:445 length:246 start_codon:yes stop_codon:yes gene_type:complete
MILYTEKQLDQAWHSDCKKRTLNDKPWLSRENYRQLFEGCLDFKVAGMHQESKYYLKTFDVHIPRYILETIEETITVESEE